MKRKMKPYDLSEAPHQSMQEPTPYNLNYPKRKKKLRCDVCGSTDISENPHMGRNCNWCNPLGERSKK